MSQSLIGGNSNIPPHPAGAYAMKCIGGKKESRQGSITLGSKCST